eukprot:TRINITY_DN3574_c0_g1_i1.p1 TRINITY_DN3574_c0_g1~~TRINITY_DN3574_c0_g1_i1.p1  ORF type:complete len:360 (+),score=62.30 TRINITY_DN3574_c0_g1_i1:66-1082(+)
MAEGSPAPQRPCRHLPQSPMRPLLDWPLSREQRKERLIYCQEQERQFGEMLEKTHVQEIQELQDRLAQAEVTISSSTAVSAAASAAATPERRLSFGGGTPAKAEFSSLSTPAASASGSQDPLLSPTPWNLQGEGHMDFQISQVASPCRRRRPQVRLSVSPIKEAVPCEGDATAPPQALCQISGAVGNLQRRTAEAKALRQTLRSDIMAEMAYLNNMLTDLQNVSSDEEVPGAPQVKPLVRPASADARTLKRDSFSASDISLQSTVEPLTPDARGPSCRRPAPQIAVPAMACQSHGANGIREDTSLALQSWGCSCHLRGEQGLRALRLTLGIQLSALKP